MSQPYINNYINNLQQKVAAAAARIKQKQQPKRTDGIFDEKTNEIRQSSGVENQAYKLMGSESAYALLGQTVPADSSYAAETYGYVSKVDKKPTVAEGLVFKNNREFDFKV